GAGGRCTRVHHPRRGGSRHPGGGIDGGGGLGTGRVPRPCGEDRSAGRARGGLAPAAGTRTPGGSRRTRCDRRTPRGRRLVARGPRRAARSSPAGVAWLHVIIEILISRPCAQTGVGPWDRLCETCRRSRGSRGLAPESWA